MNLLFVADPLETFKTYKDTTFAMMREAQRRGHAIAACEPADILWEKGRPVTAHVRDIRLTGEPEDWFRESGTRAAPLHRQDPLSAGRYPLPDPAHRR